MWFQTEKIEPFCPLEPFESIGMVQSKFGMIERDFKLNYWTILAVNAIQIDWNG